MTLWSNRMAAGPAEPMMAFTASIGVDIRLGCDDVECSIAHVHGLARAGIIPGGEADDVVDALRKVGEELASGSFVLHAEDEDVHTAIERRVTELAGQAGERLHTGRSRNDQVATALRRYTMRRLAETAAAVLSLQATLLARAREAGEATIPGYTHLQRAQPVPLAHQLLAHGWALARDVDRLCDASRRADVSPLGAGALAGSSLPLDPDGVAAEIGFAHRFENSIDAVSDRDFVAETLFGAALLGVHLSRLGEEIVIYSSEEFGFYRLDDAWSTGSSMLPQKKNPDVAELARGKTGRLIGHLTGFLTTLKGLPLSYNRDLQEDKEPLFDAFDQLALALPALEGLIATLSFDTVTMGEAADVPALAAVDLAEWLVARGMPFRAAHGLVGSLVRDSLARHVPLAELVEAHPELGPAAVEVLEPGMALRRRQTPGGAGIGALHVQLGRFDERLSLDGARVAALTPGR